LEPQPQEKGGAPLAYKEWLASYPEIHDGRSLDEKVRSTAVLKWDGKTHGPREIQ